MLLTGGSGRGKSTLLYLIAGLIEPDEGTVVVAGQDVHGLRGARRDAFRGRRIGMIFQTFNLLHGFSATENVMAALMVSSVPAREHAARARDLLRRLGIEHADRVLALEAGRLVEQGTHAELLAAGGLYARLHAMQFRT